MTRPVLTRRTALRLALAAAPAVANAAPGPPVRVASKPDTEGALLGHLILLALRRNGAPAEDRVALGPTPIVRAALLGGQIDIYPEYTGNGAVFFNQQHDPVWRDAAAAWSRDRALDAANGVVWLRPAPADNGWSIAVRADVAAARGMDTMSAFAAWANAGGRIYLAASAEFIESPPALPAFQATYGFRLRPDQLLSLAGGDTSATIRAAAERISGVNAAMAYGTDGALAVANLTVMRDDKGAQAVYAPAPVIRADALRRHPDIPAWLAPVFARLDDATLRALNARIAVDGAAPQDVAAAFLGPPA